MRQTVVTALGLLTRPNQYGAYPPGALSQSVNCCFRAQGITEAFPATEVTLANVTTTGYSIKRIFSDGWADSGNLISIAYKTADWKMARGTTAITAPFVDMPFFNVGYCNGAFARDRWFFSDYNNPVVLDSVSDTTIRYAGMQAPQIFNKNSTTTVSAQALPTGKVQAWRCFFQRVVSSSYTITGAVSNQISWTNTTGSTVDVSLQVAWPNDGQMLLGDTIELYRTLLQDSGTAPGDDEFLSLSYRLTATDIANRFAIIRDSTLDAALGASLYTNTDQEGLTGSKAVPPTSQDIASFKGYNFYVATQVANSLQVRVPGLWGSLSGAAEIKNGIGTRTYTGCTISITSPTILTASTNGVSVGQRVTHASFVNPTSIISFVANTSITCSTNATANAAAATVFTTDQLEITGTVTTASSLTNVINSLVQHDLIAVDQCLANTSAGSSNLLGASIRVYTPYAKNDDVTIRGTNGQNYSPPIPELAETVQTGTSDPRTNRLMYSELDQPEAVPEINEILVGRGTIYRIIPTRDALFIFASDGLWRLSGEDENSWRVDPVDTTLILAAPQAVGVFRETIWAYTNRGMVGISESGIKEITNGIVEDLIPNASYQATWDQFIGVDQSQNEIWLNFRSGGASTSYIFNTDTSTWTKFSNGLYLSAVAFSAGLTSQVLASEGGQPDIYKFVSTTARTTGVILQFQPIVGDGDPVSLKQFLDITCMFTKTLVPEVPDLVIPYWDGTAQGSNPLIFTNTGTGLAAEARVTFGVPRNNAVKASLRPGLSFDFADDWRFSGFSIRWSPAAEESLR